MNQVTEIVVFNVAREYAYHAFLLFFQCHNHSEFTGQGSRSEEELRKLLSGGRPVVTEWEYLKGFTVEQLNGPVIVRTTMRFVGIASNTVVVSWGYSLHPQTFLGSALTAIPRMRLQKSAPGIREALWRLKGDCEGHAFDHVLQHLMGPLPLAQLDPPEGRLQTVIDAGIWHRGMTLLEASSYFEVLREEMGSDAARFEELAQELRMAGQLHLILSSEEELPGDHLGTVARAYVENFARLALSEHTYDYDLLSSMMPYFMSLKKSLSQVGRELPRMNEEARGSRTAMAKILLEYASPDFEEMNRVAQNMPVGDVPHIFRHWAEQRQARAETADAEPPPPPQSGASTMKEIQLTCAWCDSESLMRELSPYVGHNVKFEVRHRGPRFRGGELDSGVLVAIVSGGAVVVSALINALIQVRVKKIPDGTGKFVVKSSSGISFEAPSSCTMEQLRELAEIAHTLDRPQIGLE